jgi:hypothetical protein
MIKASVEAGDLNPDRSRDEDSGLKAGKKLGP